MGRSSFEVAAIFRRYGDDYRQAHRLGPEQHKAMGDIQACRTAQLGGHVDRCSNGCGYQAISYNSCRNRHCPKCQSLNQAKWLEERTLRLLPTRYFHLVVTLPHELAPLTLSNRKLLFNLLFEAASKALLEFALSYQRLRAQIGFTAVLHTWDQQLNFHPHLHIVATGGGLSKDGKRWICAANSFLLPVKALSIIIRARFIETLEGLFREGKLKGNLPCLANPTLFLRLLRKLRRIKWVVYSKELLDSSKKAYDYLSRYTHRVAISNHRLTNVGPQTVTFRARDNRNPGRHRLITIPAPEFIRRFLLHILPARFVKIRHFGLMASCNAKTKLERARLLITQPDSGDDLAHADAPKHSKAWQEVMLSLTGIDLSICPQCRRGILVRFKLTEVYPISVTTILDSS